LAGADLAIDARSLPGDEQQLAEVVEANRVFGRVTPEQKRAMVGALRSKGHVVAMTGDGVNDTLALKDADLGIAMGSGSAVARGVAQLVLLDDQFEVLPAVVAEGRQVLRNIERVAWLFLVKNVYSVVLSVVVAAAGWTYPFLPRHLTLISGLGIGVPGFFLALAPGSQRFEPGFVRRVLRFSVPAGAITAGAVMASYGIARHQGAAVDQSRTMAVAVTALVSVLVVVLASWPLQPWKLGMAATMAVAFVGAFTLPGINRFFSIERRPSVSVMVEVGGVGLAACAVIVAVTGAMAVARRHGSRSATPLSAGVSETH
jgi:cation-transporting ATPase E